MTNERWQMRNAIIIFHDCNNLAKLQERVTNPYMISYFVKGEITHEMESILDVPIITEKSMQLFEFDLKALNKVRQ